MPDDNGVLLTRITIERRLIGDTDQVFAHFEDSRGDTPPLLELLGMLSLTKDTAIREAMGEASGDDDV